MNNFTAIVAAIKKLVGNHALVTDTVAGEIANSVHSDMVDAHKWSYRRSEITLTGYADKTGGTVSVTNGSATIAGVGTAWLTTDTGKFINISSIPFVFTYVSPTSGTLSDVNGSAVTYPGATATGLPYTLYKRFYSLGPGVENVYSARREFPITERDQGFVDSIDPLRISTSDHPVYYSRGPWSSDQDAQIELFPRLSMNTAFTVNVLRTHATLSGTQKPLVPSTLVEWYGGSKAALFLFAKTKEDKWLKLAPILEKFGKDAFDLERIRDSDNFGKSPAVKDSAIGMGIGATDFALTHDIGRW